METPDNVIPENELARRRRVLQLSDEIVDLCKDLVDRASEFRDLGVPARDWWPLILEHAPEKLRSYADHPFQRMIAATLIDAMVQMSRGEPVKFDFDLTRLFEAARDGDDAGDDDDDDDGDGYGYDDADGPPGGLLSRLLPLLMGFLTSRPSTTPPSIVPASGLLAEICGHLDAAPKVKEQDAPAIECTLLLRGAAGPAIGVLSRAKSMGVFRMLSPASIAGKQVMVEQFFSYADIVSFALIRPIEAKSALFT